MSATATALLPQALADRKRLRQLAGSRDDVARKHQEAAAKLRETQARFDRGECTEKAVELAQNVVRNFQQQLFHIDNEVPRLLVNGCADPGLRHEFGKLLKQKGPASQKVQQINAAIRDLELRLSQARDEAEKRASVGISFLGKLTNSQAARDAEEAKRSIAQMVLELADLREDLAAAETEQAELLTAIDEHKAKMMAV